MVCSGRARSAASRCPAHLLPLHSCPDVPVTLLLQTLSSASSNGSRGNAQTDHLLFKQLMGFMKHLVSGALQDPCFAATHTLRHSKASAVWSVADQLVEIKFCRVTLTHTSWLVALVNFHRSWSHTPSHRFIIIHKVAPRPSPSVDQCLGPHRTYIFCNYATSAAENVFLQPSSSSSPIF